MIIIIIKKYNITNTLECSYGRRTRSDRRNNNNNWRLLLPAVNVI
jgi:hypothetical protein